MSERAEPRWTTTSWRGNTNYECTGQVGGAPCQFKTLDRGAMLEHQRVAHRDSDPLTGVTFASAAAEKAARKAELTAVVLQKTTPSGAGGGYTMADVTAAAKSRNPEG